MLNLATNRSQASAYRRNAQQRCIGMTTTYGPAERLAEQIDILLRDPGPTEIVLLTTLGEAALPKLCAHLDADTRGKRQWSHAIAVIRVLGMSGHPSVVPSLTLRLSTFKQDRYGRDETEPRAIAHALRKVGNDDALRALVDNLQRVDLAHAKTVLDHFGRRASEALIAKTAQFDNPAWLEAAKLVTAMKLKEGPPLLIQAAEKNLAAHNLLAYYGKDAPKEWATRRLLAIQPFVTKQYIKTGRRHDEYGYRHDTKEGIHPEHDALLKILHHVDEPSVLRDLVPYLEIEHSAGLTGRNHEPPPSVTLLALAFGERALPYLEESLYPDQSADTLQALREIRTSILAQAKQRAEAANARKNGWSRGDEGTIHAPAFKLEKSALGDVEIKGDTDPLPAPRTNDDSYDDDE